jgi:hypothetical protein
MSMHAARKTGMHTCRRKIAGGNACPIPIDFHLIMLRLTYMTIAIIITPIRTGADAHFQKRPWYFGYFFRYCTRDVS